MITRAAPMKLSEKVRAQDTAVVIVDMQNDFLSNGGASDLAGKPVTRLRSVLPPLVKLVSQARAVGLPIVYVISVYGSAEKGYLSDVWLEQSARRGDRRYREIPMCAADTWGARVVQDIEPKNQDIITAKHRFGGFHDTTLQEILQARGMRTLVITGILTHVCVLATAIEAISRDYFTVIPEDCVADWSEEDHRFGLQTIDSLFGQVTNSTAIRAAWEGKIAVQ